MTFRTMNYYDFEYKIFEFEIIRTAKLFEFENEKV